MLTEAEARKVTLGALVGTAMEWYDFFLFSAAAALVFNVQYFANDDAAAAAMASFATFGVGLVARPLGGMCFGRMGGRIGGRTTLMVTIIGIGIVTGFIGMLPTYAAIGIAAPILLVLLRVVQGLFVGGEWAGAMTIVVENAPLEYRARCAAIPQIGSPIGTILSSGGFFLATMFFSQDNFDAFGWRIPFLAAIPMLLPALWIRSKLEESPVFQELLESNEVVKSPITTTMRDSWKHIIVGMAAALLGVGGFYLVTTFVVWYGVNVLGESEQVMLLGTLFAAAVEIPVLLGMTIAVSFLSLPYAAPGTVLTGLFPANTRFTGLAFAQNTAGMLSGFVPLLTTALVASAGNHWWPAAGLLVVVSVFTAVAGYPAPRMSQDLPGFKH